MPFRWTSCWATSRSCNGAATSWTQPRSYWAAERLWISAEKTTILPSLSFAISVWVSSTGTTRISLKKTFPISSCKWSWVWSKTRILDIMKSTNLRHSKHWSTLCSSTAAIAKEEVIPSLTSLVLMLLRNWFSEWFRWHPRRTSSQTPSITSTSRRSPDFQWKTPRSS